MTLEQALVTWLNHNGYANLEVTQLAGFDYVPATGGDTPTAPTIVITVNGDGTMTGGGSPTLQLIDTNEA